MIVLTLFDYNSYPPKPISTIINGETINLYLKGTGKSLYDVRRDIQEITSKIELCKEPVLLNDPKSHIMAFSINKYQNLHQINLTIPDNIPPTRQPAFLVHLANTPIEPEKWRNIAANSAAVYIDMENQPIYLDEVRVYPRYSLDTYTGRSRCYNYNIQGAPSGSRIKMADADSLFVCLDWIAADIRVAAAMSNDEFLNESFKISDPHTMLAESLGLPRDECKRLNLMTLYSLNLNSAILEVFPQLKEWMIGQLSKLETYGYLDTYLGRRFKLGARDTKSVFNAVLQGTVAHAMQQCLVRMTKIRKFLLTETHDSVVFFSKPQMIPHILREAIPIMLQPLDGFARFPLRAYVGAAWKKWKLYKEFR